MTTDVATPPPAPAPPPAAPGRRRRKGPGWLGWSLLIALAVLLITVAGIAITSTGTNDTPLHPKNPGSDGTMAMAEVLAEHGVAVRTMTRHERLLRADPGPDDTVVITETRALDRGVARRLRPVLQQAGRVVIVTDDFTRLPDLGLPVSLIRDYGSDTLTANCSSDVVPTDARVSELERVFEATDPGWQGCFGTDDGHAMQLGPYGQGTAVVIGSTEFAENGNILAEDNAQLALWLYGSQSRLLWYRPDVGDTLDDGSEPAESDVSIAPAWFAPVMVLLGFAVIGLMIAQGRRFGPLSREPMPVVVSALETPRTRGRLYRGADDIPHSAQLLRAAAVRRLARLSGLPAGSDADRVAALLSARHPNARAVLTGPLPSTADQAVQWLHDLRQLEDEVAHD